MLKIENAHKTFNPRTVNANKVLRGLNLVLEEGDFVTLIGGNGAGKSTLLNAIAGSFYLDQGQIILDGADISKESEVQRAALVSRVFQDPLMGTAPRMTVKENLKIALHRGEDRPLANTMDAATEDLFRDRLSRVQMGLEDRLDEEVGALSGGQRQVIALLMATLKPPKILLLDEHTAALDPSASRAIMDLTRQIVEEEGISTLMITHNMQEAIDYGNRLIMLDQGQVVLDFSGQAKADLTLEGLVKAFSQAGQAGSLSDSMIINAAKSQA